MGSASVAVMPHRSKIPSKHIYSRERARNRSASQAVIESHSISFGVPNFMAWFILSKIFSTVLTLFRLGHTSEADKDLEILILRQQLSILQRQIDKPIKPNRAEKLTLAVLSANLKKQTKRPAKKFRSLIRIFQPETVFGWHRQLVKRKWTHPKKSKVGRPPTTDKVKALVVHLALENYWGYGKIKGELLKLGIKLSLTPWAISSETKASFPLQSEPVLSAGRH